MMEPQDAAVRTIVRNVKTAKLYLVARSTAEKGRPCQDVFAAYAKCCGTAFGKEGSLLPFAVIAEVA
jgi:hypothetical protein